MFWRIIFSATLLCLGFISSQAWAEDTAQAGGARELGALLGAVGGGGLAPGGVLLDGRFLYRMSDKDWFEGNVDFSFGGDSPSCYRDRSSQLRCTPPLQNGFSAGVLGGIRRYFHGQKNFRPYVNAKVGLRMLSFARDDLRALELPLRGGAGLRVGVAPQVFVVAESQLRLGLAFWNRGLGWQGNASLAVAVGVEFILE